MGAMAHVSADLIAAVESTLEEHGWAGATAESIAAVAGVNRVTLYRQGHTREGLLAAAALAASEEFKAAALPCLAARGSARERLLLLVVALYDLADRHLPLLAGLYDGPTAMFHMGIAEKEVEVVTRLEYTEPFERLLEDGRVDGTLRSDHPSQDAELLFNAIGWTYVHLRRSHRWSARKARAAVTNMALSRHVADLPGGGT